MSVKDMLDNIYEETMALIDEEDYREYLIDRLAVANRCGDPEYIRALSYPQREDEPDWEYWDRMDAVWDARYCMEEAVNLRYEIQMLYGLRSM
jgi:hypothetical protein